MRNMRAYQEGFTLIELVIVIVILGLLAATALPRFINITRDARIASVNGVAGGLRGAASLARAQYIVTGSTTATSVNMDGVTVTTNISGYPTNASTGIEEALQGTSDSYNITHSAPNSVYEPKNGGGTDCRATYNANSGTVVVLSTGC